MQLLGEQLVVPGRDLGQPVVGDHEGSPLRLAQMLETNGRDFAQSRALGREQPPVACNDATACVDQHRDVETEALDAFGQTTQLPGAMNARVFRTRDQRVDREIADFKLPPCAGGIAVGGASFNAHRDVSVESPRRA